MSLWKEWNQDQDKILVDHSVVRMLSCAEQKHDKILKRPCF